MSRVYCQNTFCKYNDGNLDTRNGFEANGGQRYYICFSDSVFVGEIYCHSYKDMYQKAQDVPKGTSNQNDGNDKSST